MSSVYEPFGISGFRSYYNHMIVENSEYLRGLGIFSIQDYSKHNNSVIANYWDNVRQTGDLPEKWILKDKRVSRKILFLKKMMYNYELPYTREKRLWEEVRKHFLVEINFVIANRHIIQNPMIIDTFDFMSYGLFKWMHHQDPEELFKFKHLLCMFMKLVNDEIEVQELIFEIVVWFLTDALLCNFIKL